MIRRPTTRAHPRALLPSSASALLVALAFALSACGGSSPATIDRSKQSANALVAEALAAVAIPKYVEFSGSVAETAGNQTSSISAKNVVESRTSTAGTITITGNPTGVTSEHFAGTVSFVVANQITWVEGDDEFWDTLLATSSASKAEIKKLLPHLTGQWIELISASTANFNADTSGLIDPRGFVEEFLNQSETKLKKDGLVSVGGHETVQLSTTRGAVVNLAATGSPLPIVVQTKAPSALKTYFTYSYPNHADVSPPKHFQYLDTVLKPYEKPNAS